MECNKWESEGLLFSSDELSESEASSFKQHLQSCTYCREELDSYSELHNMITETGVLLDTCNCNNEDLLLAEFRKKSLVKTNWFMPLFTVFEKTAIPLFLIAAAFFIGKTSFNNDSQNLIATKLDTVKIADTINADDSAKIFLEGGNGNGTVPVSVKDK